MKKYIENKRDSRKQKERIKKRREDNFWRE